MTTFFSAKYGPKLARLRNFSSTLQYIDYLDKESAYNVIEEYATVIEAVKDIKSIVVL